MNYPAAMFWMNFALAVINLAGVVYVWWSNKQKVTTAKFDELKGHITRVDGDVKGLNVKFDSLPVCNNHSRMEQNDVKLFERLDQLHGDVRELCGGVKRLTGSLNMIQQHLMNGGK